MKKNFAAFWLFALLAIQASAYRVSVDTYVSNAGKTVTVPVVLDNAVGLSYASATLTYDPQILVVTKAEAGSLKTLMSDDFVAADTNGTIAVSIFCVPGENVTTNAGGSIASITFAVRDGTEGQFSDIAVTEVELGEKTGVLDVAVGNPITTVNGMIRVMGAGADVARLENAQIVSADTVLGSLVLADGDAIQASDNQTAIHVAGAVTATGAIPVKPPVNGWVSGTYALLSTTAAGLKFTGVAGEISVERVGGITTYYANVFVAGEPYDPNPVNPEPVDPTPDPAPDPTPSTATVLFDANGGTLDSSDVERTVSAGEAVGELPVPVREGCVLDGWFTAAQGGEMVTDETVVTNDVTFYAHWTLNQYTVTFNAGAHGSLAGDAEQTIDHGETAAIPDATPNAGYAFVGWDGDVTAPIVSNATFTAQYEVIQYAIAYADLKGAENPNPTTYTVEDAITFAEPGNVYGWVFKSWTPASIALGTTGAVEVVASWERAKFDVTVNGETRQYSYEEVATFAAPEAFETNGMQVVALGTTFTAPVVTNEFAVTVTGGIEFEWDILATNWWFEAAEAQNGSIVAPDAGWMADGTNFVLKVDPAEYYHFVRWIGDMEGCTETDTSLIVAMDRPRAIGAEFAIDTFSVTFDANGGVGGWSRTMDYGAAIVAPTVTREGYTFTGWAPAVPAAVQAWNATYIAQWERNVPELFEDVGGAAPTVAASEYNGYLYDPKSGAVKGTIQVKVGKAGKKDGKASVKATVIVGTKKVTLKAAEKGKAVINPDGPTTIQLVGGEACEIVLGVDGVSGAYGAYLIDGSRDFFASKDKGEVSAATAVLDKWLGSVNIVWDGGSLNVNIAAKGKVKVSGTLADGKTKVSVSTVLLVGEEWSCVSVAAQKANLAFVLWLSHDGQTIKVEGLGDNVLVGKVGTLAGGATFRIDADEIAGVFGQAMLPYLPNGVSVTQKGTKWTLPKAGKVAYKNGAVDSSKLGENPCGLKLTYKSKDGTFKGSFKVYAEVKGKPKATTVNVTGFMLNGVGYGTATIKGKNGSVAVTIE